MSLTIKCPGCGKSYRVREENVGGRAHCQDCGASFTVTLGSGETGVKPADPLPTEAAGPAVPAPASGPRKIGRYQVVRKLGAGGMGVVWLARDPDLQRSVALKTLPAAFAADRERLQRFLREARAAAKLDHPNIVAIYEAGVEADTAFIAMELIEGGSLAAAGRKQPLPWREATRAMRDAAAGLAAAHEAGLVHRDVKPGNLLRDKSGTVKVVDFGLARAHCDTTLTQEGALLGTPDYMPPEVWMGGQADARSDVYALMCTYYFLLTGGAPFKAANIPALGYQHRHEPLPDVRQQLPDLPPDISRVLARGTHKDPQQRYASCTEVVAELDALLSAPDASGSAESIAATATWIAAPSGSATASGRGPRRRILVAAGGGVLLVLLAALGWWLMAGGKPAAAPEPATELAQTEAPAKPESPSAETPVPAPAAAAAPAAPDGSAPQAATPEPKDQNPANAPRWKDATTGPAAEPTAKPSPTPAATPPAADTPPPAPASPKTPAATAPKKTAKRGSRPASQKPASAKPPKRETKVEVEASTAKITGEDPEEAILRALGQKVTLEFKETPLVDVVSYLQDLAKIPIYVDARGLEDLGVDADTPVTLAVKQLTLDAALKQLLSQLQCTATIWDDVLLLTTPDRESARLTTRLYALNGSGPAPGSPTVITPRAANSRAGSRVSLGDELVNAMTSTIQPTSWDSVGGPGSIDFVSPAGVNVLIVSQTGEMQRQIENFLRQHNMLVAGAKRPLARPAPVRAVPAKGKAGTAETLEQALEKKYSCQFVEAPLKVVAEKLGAAAGINLQLDGNAIQALNVALDAPVTFQAKDLRLRAVLSGLLRNLQLTWLAQEGMLLITSPEVSDGRLSVRSYLVADLAGPGAVMSSRGARVAYNDYEYLIEALTSTVAPTTWDSVGGPGSIAPINAPAGPTLAVSQSYHVQLQVARVLEELHQLAARNLGKKH